MDLTQPKLFMKHAKRVEEDYQRMKDWLPKEASSVLDIGSGYAMIDILIARHYGGAIDIHLMDADTDTPRDTGINRGYHGDMKAWNDRNAGVENVQRELPECRVYGHPPDPGLTIPCDLIISRRSWGHHYPVEMYAELAERSLSKYGRIILDIRHRIERYGVETQGINALLARGFRILSDGLEVRSVKCKRYALVR